MSNKVLVTYATRYGSTQAAADEVVVALRHRGFEVDLQLMRDDCCLCRNTDPYTIVLVANPSPPQGRADSRRLVAVVTRCLPARVSTRRPQ